VKRWGTMAVVAVAVLGLLAPVVSRAAVPGTSFKKVLSQGDAKGAGVGDLEIVTLNNLGHFPFITEPADDNVPGVGGEVMFFWDGSKVSGPVGRSGSIWNPASSNDQDQVAVTLQAGDDNGHNETRLYDFKAGTMKVLINAGMPVPGGGTVDTANGRISCSINEKGQVASAINVDGGLGVVVVEPDGKFTLVARKDTAGPGGKKFEAASAPWINDSGAVVFQDQPYDTTEGSGVYLWDGGKITAIATPGMDVPGGGKITNAEYPVINNDGDVAFRGTLDDTEALFAWRKSTGKLALIAKKGTDLGGGALFEQVEGNRRHAVEINNKGVVCASIWIGEGDDGGVITYNLADGKTAIVVKTGDDLGAGIGKVDGIANGRGGINSFNVAINDNGVILFAAKVGGSDLQSLILATPAPPVAGQ
jgi:hypothetical protein